MADSRAEILSEIFRKFDIRYNPEKYKMDYPDGLLRKASILIPLYYKDGEYWIILTLRSKNLTHHAGYVAFPGGMADKTDTDEVHTALREAEEEIGLKPDQVQVVGLLCPGIVKPNSLVYPVIGLVPADFKPVINECEVSLVFNLPLKRFLTKERLHMEEFRSHIQTTYHVYHFEDYVEGRTVDTWGITASFCVMTALAVLGSDEKFCFYENFIIDKYSVFGVEGTKHAMKKFAEASKL